MLIRKITTKVVAFAVMIALALTLLVPVASYASAAGRRNTAIGLGAVSVYLLLKGKTTPGLVTAGGAVYAYNRYKDAREDEQKRERYRQYRYDRHRR